MEPDRTAEAARQKDKIVYRCPACGTENVYDLQRFDLEAPHRCASCGRPVFGAVSEEDLQ